MLSAMLLALALLMGGCGSDADERADRIVYGALTEPVSLCPLVGTDSASSEVQSLIYNALVCYDDEHITGDLAESWTVSDSGKVYTFCLRGGVYWHDGVPFTAEDVVFTVRLALDPSSAYLDARELANIAHVSADGKKVRFFLREADNAFLARLTSLYILPKHIWERVASVREASDIAPIGTGAYRFALWKKAQYLKLTANERYHRGAPSIKTLFYKIVPDTNVLAMQLRRGDVDVCRLDASAEAMLASDASVKITTAPSRAYTYIAVNHTNPIFADGSVRRAMVMATARQDIIDKILLGGAYLAYGDLPPSILKCEGEAIAYDVREANRLLDETGWKMGTGGVRSKDGKKMHFSLLVPNRNKRSGDVALAFRQNMRAVGIVVDIVPMDFATMRTKHFLTGDYEACLISQRLVSDPLLREEVWTSEGASNHAAYRNPRLDALYHSARTAGKDERRTIFCEIERTLAQDAPQIFLWYPAVIIGTRAELTGIDASHLGAKDNIFYNVETWTKVRQ